MTFASLHLVRPARLLQLLIISTGLLLVGAARAHAANDLTISAGPTVNVNRAVVGGNGVSYNATAPGANLSTTDIATDLANPTYTSIDVNTGFFGVAVGDITVQAPLSVPAGKQLGIRSTTGTGSVVVNSTLDGPGDLSILGASNVIGTDVGSGAALSQLSVADMNGGATGTVSLGGAAPTSFRCALCIFFQPTTLLGDVTMPGATQFNHFTSVDGGHVLSITNSVRFDGAVGAVTPLTSLTISGATTTYGDVTTTGAQSFGSLTLNGARTLRAGGGITTGLLGSVGAPASLSIPTAASVTTSGGSLASIDVTPPTTLGGSVTTSGAQTFGALVLSANATLQSTGGGAVTTGAVSGAHALTFATSGGSHLTGDAGASGARLTSLTSSGSGSFDPAGHSVFTSGAIAITGPLQSFGTASSSTAGLTASSTVQAGVASTIDVATASTIVGAVSGGTLTKQGAGSLRLQAADTQTGLAVAGGSVRVDGDNSSAPTTVSSGTLEGAGTVGDISTTGGSVAPGTTAGSTIGTLTTSQLTTTGATTLSFRLSSSPAASKLAVSGAVTLGASTALSVDVTSSPSQGSTLTILDKLGAGAVSGTFAGLPEGGVLHDGVSGLYFRVSYVGGTGNDITITRVPAPLTTTTLLTVAPNPATAGQSVTLSASVSSSGTPTGTVSFDEGATHICSATLAAGSASCSSSTFAVGSHPIVGTYGGDGSNAGSASAPTTLVVNLSSSTTMLAITPNPSTAGQSVTFSATITGVAPTGPVVFREGATSVCTATAVAGAASCSSAALGVGSHSIIATYAGDASNAGSSSAPTTLAVDKAASSGSLTQSSTQSAAGSDVTFTATFTGAGGTPTGTVTFTDGGATIGTATLASGVASLTTAGLAPGTHTIAAMYAGDAVHTGAATSAASHVVTPVVVTPVTPPPTTDPAPVPTQATTPAAAPAPTPTPAAVPDRVPPPALVAVSTTPNVAPDGTFTVKFTCAKIEKACIVQTFVTSSLEHHVLHPKASDGWLVGKRSIAVAPGATVTIKLHLSRAARAEILRRPTRAVLRLAITDAAGNVTRYKHVVLLRAPR